MKKNTYIFIIIILVISELTSAQTYNHCGIAMPICTDQVYNLQAPIDTFAEVGPDYGCLITQLNPLWFYLKVTHPGNIALDIQSATSQDIDFAAWGPFYSAHDSCVTGLSAFCDTCPSNTDSTHFYPSGNLTDCSYSTNSYEVCHISNALTGQYYYIVITNKSNSPNTIFLYQSNTADTNAATFCDTVTTVNSNTIEEEALFSFSPNPTNQLLNLYFNQMNDNSIIIISDLLGTERMRFKCKGQFMQLDLSSIVNGNYIIQCINEKKVFTGKFVLKK